MPMAEMKAPGEALLDFQIKSGVNDQAELQLLSKFYAQGAVGNSLLVCYLPSVCLAFRRHAQIHRQQCLGLI